MIEYRCYLTIIMRRQQSVPEISALIISGNEVYEMEIKSTAIIGMGALGMM